MFNMHIPLEIMLLFASHRDLWQLLTEYPNFYGRKMFREVEWIERGSVVKCVGNIN